MPASDEIIDQLLHGQALAVLKTLAASDEQLANRIAEMGPACLSQTVIKCTIDSSR